MEKSQKKLVLILIVLHLAVSLPLAYFLNVWSDEASTLETTNHGFAFTFETIFKVEKQSPLYFLLLSLWRNLDTSVFSARILSIIFSVASIAVLPNVAKNWLNEKQTKYFTIFFALHPFLFLASLEIRGYSAIILLSILLFKFFCQGYLLEDETTSHRKWQIIYVLISIISLYTHYYLGFNLVAHFCVLLVLRRWKDAKNYLLQMLFVGVCIIPLLSVISQQFAGREAFYTAEKSVVILLRTLWASVLTFTIPTEILPTPEPTIISIFRNRILLIIFAIFAVYSFATKFRKFNQATIIFATTNFVMLVFMALSYFALGEIYIAIRHFSPLFVSIIFLQFVVLSTLINEKFNKIWLVFGLICLCLFPYSLYKLYPNIAKRGDWARVAEFVQQNEKPNQPIIIFQVYDVLSFRVHYQGANKILPDEKFVDFWLEGKKETEDSLRSQIDFTISKIPPEAADIWLLTEDNCQTTAACQPLEDFVAKNYNVIETKDFYLEKARLLRKK
jgi:hypothetical protein